MTKRFGLFEGVNADPSQVIEGDYMTCDDAGRVSVYKHHSDAPDEVVGSFNVSKTQGVKEIDAGKPF